MKILIAPDSFKNSMTAKVAAAAIAEGARKVFPGIELLSVPLSDGGEGFTESVIGSAGGTYIEVPSHDALMRNIRTRIGLTDDKRTAIIELAAAAGIERLTNEELNPLVATTYGVGELVHEALNLHCNKIVIGLGGSATNDGGVGLATALGVRFLDGNEEPVGLGADALDNIRRIDISNLDPRLANTEVVIACDVTNVLCGPEGASAVYGPQKGATPAMVIALDNKLAHYASLLKQQFGKDFGVIPGSGAAGGTATSLLVFTKSHIVPGFDVVKEITKLEEKINDFDLVITGEGKIDSQTAFGKAPGKIAELASKHRIPVAAFAGILGDGYETLYQKGFSVISSIVDPSMPLAYALANGPQLLAQATERFFMDLKSGTFTPM
jgi:glycerate kinase